MFTSRHPSFTTLRSGLILNACLTLLAFNTPMRASEPPMENGVCRILADGVQVGDAALPFKGVDAAGQPVELASLKGKTVLLCLSTMWCGPCKQESPTLESLYQKYQAQGFTVVQAILQNEGKGKPSNADLKRWADTYSLTFPVIAPEASSASAYKIKGVPTNIIIDKNGVIQYRQSGFEESSMVAKIEALLQQ